MTHLEESINLSNSDSMNQAENTGNIISIAELMQESSEDQEHQVTESTKEHLINLHQLLKTSILKIKTKVRKLAVQFLKTKRINIDKLSRAYVQKMVEIFEKASNTIIEAFYVVASNEEYLQFESQSSMKEKLGILKRQVSRSFMESMKRATKTKEELQFEDQEESELKKRLKAKNCKIPASSTVILERWLTENFYFPYPTEKERQNLSKESSMSLVQVNNWFINKREKIIRKYLKKDTRTIQDSKQQDSGVSEQEQSFEFDEERSISNQ